MYRRQTNGWLKHLDFIVLDLFCLEAAFVLAYWARIGWSNPYATRLYQSMAFMLLLMDVAVIFFGNAYSGVLERGYWKEASSTLRQSALILALSSVYLVFIQNGDSYSRIILCLTALFYFFLSYGCRLLWKRAVKWIPWKMKQDSLLIAVTEAHAAEIVESLQHDQRRHFSISGIILMDEGVHTGVEQLFVKSYGNIPVVATERGLVEYVCREWVDEILFVLPDWQGDRAVIEEVAASGIAVHEYLGMEKSRVGRKQVIEKMGDYAVMTTCTNCVTFSQAFLKRTFDIVGGLVGSIFAVLALMIVGPMIYAQSPGPLLFRQVRVGRNGRRFHFLKIRSMVIGADAMKKDLMEQNRVKDGMMFKLDFDPRIIGAKKLPDGSVKRGIGNIIRDWSIDELPQFFNVLKGDMSLVGTRPPTVDEWEKYQLHHRARMAFRPGITGLWQVSGRSNIVDFEEVVKLDTKYINEWDFGLDCRIMLDTVRAVLERTGSM